MGVNYKKHLLIVLQAQ